MGRRGAGVIEITALFAAPIAYAVAFGQAVRGTQGLALAFAALGVGVVSWALITFALERRLRGSATSGRATGLGLGLGIAGGVGTALVIQIAARPGSLLLPLLAGLFVMTQVSVLLNDRQFAAAASESGSLRDDRLRQ